jgi:predicted DNA-binding protein
MSIKATDTRTAITLSKETKAKLEALAAQEKQ